MSETQELVTKPAQSLDRPQTAVEIRAQVNLIQEVLQAVMKEGTHYGTIPGTPKPTLFKAGAEKILMTFRIAATVGSIEDLSTPDAVRYRVTMRATAQGSGALLGEGSGECSSDEEKYRWRRPVHPKEWDAAPDDRKREKWTRDGDTWKQIRTEPADVANTILKMAVKRALIAMTLVVTAASDVFAQDIEDLPEEVREAVLEGEEQTKPTIQPPQRRAPASAPPTNGPCILSVDTKSGETNGKPWTFYAVKFSDNREAVTFDEQVAKLAMRLRDEKASVVATIEPHPKKAGKFTLTELARAVVTVDEAF